MTEFTLISHPLRQLGHGKLTAHGFRSTLLDHTIGNAVEAAYRRGDQSAWAGADGWHVGGPSGGEGDAVLSGLRQPRQPPMRDR
jgi:hypothetical protein